MIANNDRSPPSAGVACRRFSRRRFVPLAIIAIVSIGVVVLGWHRQVSFETLARHHEALRDFIAMHEVSAVAAYVTLYVVVAALSMPVGIYLTVIGGIL